VAFVGERPERTAFHFSYSEDLVSYCNYRRNMLCLPNRKNSKEDVKASMPSLVSSASDLARAMSNTPRPWTRRLTFGLLLERDKDCFICSNFVESSLCSPASEAISMIA